MKYMSLEGEVIKTKGKHKESSLLVIEDKHISDGNFSEVSSLDTVLQRGERGKSVHLVRKRYRHGLDPTTPHKWREHAVTVYAYLKDIGLQSIPKTFRPYDEDEILMTDFTVGGKMALAANPLGEPRVEKIESLVNFEKMVLEIAPDILCAARRGVNLSSDCFFLVVPRGGENVPGKMVTGDIENITVTGDGKQPLVGDDFRVLLNRNIAEFSNFFPHFLKVQQVFSDTNLYGQYAEQARKILRGYAADDLGLAPQDI